METKPKYYECYVAFLDILGFKEIVSDKERFDDILRIFKTIASAGEFKKALCRASDGNDVYAEYNSSLEKINIYAMSDSIVISSPVDTPYSLEALIDVCVYMQGELFDFEQPVLLRGAVAKGEYFCESSVAFGRGMVDAYLFQENYSIYPRIILSQDIVDGLRDEKYKLEKLVYSPKDAYYHIDCIADYLGQHKKSDMECVKFENMIKKYLDDYYDSSIRQKYIWLKKEYQRVVEHMIDAENISLIVED